MKRLPNKTINDKAKTAQIKNLINVPFDSLFASFSFFVVFKHKLLTAYLERVPQSLQTNRKCVKYPVKYFKSSWSADMARI